MSTPSHASWCGSKRCDGECWHKDSASPFDELLPVKAPSRTSHIFAPLEKLKSLPPPLHPDRRGLPTAKWVEGRAATYLRTFWPDLRGPNTDRLVEIMGKFGYECMEAGFEMGSPAAQRRMIEEVAEQVATEKGEFLKIEP